MTDSEPIDAVQAINATECAPAGMSAPQRRHVYAGLKAGIKFAFSRCWLPRYLRTPFPDVLAHHPGPSLFWGHGAAFRAATTVRGEDASSYFRRSGISACAETNGGLCTFRLGRDVAIYQITNQPLVPDEILAPSIDANAGLFGSFLGSLPSDHTARHGKRAAVESSLGNEKFIDELEPSIREHAINYLNSAVGRELRLDDFALLLVAHVDSLVPGVLDLTQKSLPAYLTSGKHSWVARAFFEIASAVISKVRADMMEDCDLIVDFTRDILRDNFDALSTAPDTNIIRRHFALWGQPFTRNAIDALGSAELKELGTVIVATYDTTALSLLWAIDYLETSPAQKKRVVAQAHAAVDTKSTRGSLSSIDLAVLEALRLGGSNPTALWRRTKKPFVLRHRGRAATVPPGTMIWLDRRAANRDRLVFAEPDKFEIANISGLLKSEREKIQSVLSRSRYEINSFSMVNSERNPRKCPGRLFSVRLQSILLSELYARYDITVRGIDLELKKHSSMPRPAQPGTIIIMPRSTTASRGIPDDAHCRVDRPPEGASVARSTGPGSLRAEIVTSSCKEHQA